MRSGSPQSCKTAIVMEPIGYVRTAAGRIVVPGLDMFDGTPIRDIKPRASVEALD